MSDYDQAMHSPMMAQGLGQQMKDESPLIRQLGELNRSISMIDSAISSLHERLIPVMRSSPSEVERSSPPHQPPGESAVVDLVSSETDRLNAISRRIHYMLETLEV